MPVFYSLSGQKLTLWKNYVNKQEKNRMDFYFLMQHAFSLMWPYFINMV